MWMISLKRLLKPGTILLLAAVLLSVWAGGQVGHSARLRPCGVVCEDADARDVLDALAGDGFAVYEDRAAMEADVSRGKLDCGAVLLPGLGAGIAAGNPAGHVLLLTAPDSFLTEAYEAKLHAALYAASAPALTVQAAQEAGVALNREQVIAELNRLREAGARFRFRVTTVSGAAPELPDTGRQVSRAAAALLLFAAILTGTQRAVTDADRLRPRIGRRAAIAGVLAPGLFWQGALYALAAGVTLREDTGALIGYILLLTALGLILARVPLQWGVLLPVCLLGALALLPIYYDVTEFYPQAAVLRYFLPPCWLLLLTEHPPAAALGVVTPLILLFYPGGNHDRI